MIQDDKDMIRRMAGHIENLLIGWEICAGALTMLGRIERPELEKVMLEAEKVQDFLEEVNTYTEKNKEFKIKKLTGWKVDDPKSESPLVPLLNGMTVVRIMRPDPSTAHLN
jgi:hypothetical protein